MRPCTFLAGSLMVVIMSLIYPSQLISQLYAAMSSQCEAPEYFGMCDPFVPGIVIASFGDKKPIRVVSTWSSGPAERAGVCPGDEILAVNGVFTLQNTRDQILREIVSDSPSPVLLRVSRDNQETEFRVPRVRESTLAELSKQKYLRWQDIEERRLTLVPLSETREELKILEDFRKRIAARNGFKWVEGLSVPIQTPEEQVRKLLRLRAAEYGRLKGMVSVVPGGYSAGFTFLSLKDPVEVFINYVAPHSPAHKGGVLPGDRLQEVNGRAVSGLSLQELGNLLFKPDEKRQMQFKLKRGDSEIALDLETERAEQFMKSGSDRELPGSPGFSSDSHILGIQALYIDNPPEAIVAKLVYPSPAFDAGLHSGDLILAVNGTGIGQISRELLTKTLAPTQHSDVTLQVSRLGKKSTFQVTTVTYAQALAGIGRQLTKLGSVPQHCEGSSLASEAHGI